MNSPIPPHPEHPADFRRSAVRVSATLRIKTICKRCSSEFIGNADDIARWETQHFNQCSKSALA